MMFSDASITTYCLFLLAVLYLVRWRLDPLRSIPTAGGFSSPVLSYLTALYTMLHAKEMVDTGVRKFYGSAFKIPLLDRWMVIVSGPNMVDELRRRPEEELSVMDGLLELVQLQYMIGDASKEDPAHSIVVHEKLTARMLTALVPEMADELQSAVQDHLPVSSTDGWISIDAFPTVHKIVTRLCTRVFVGLDACRDEEYLKLAGTFTVDIMKAAFILGFLPRFMKPLVAPLINTMSQTVRRAAPHLAPIVNERREHMGVLGSSWEDRPVGTYLQYAVERAAGGTGTSEPLMWLILERCPPMAYRERRKENHTDSDIIESLFLVNLAAIHNSSSTLTHTLYHLAESPGYVASLREEIEAVLLVEGWTATALNKMEKLDSFLTECQRYTGLGLTSMIRKAVKDITLNDGTSVPRGTLIQVAAHSVHLNEAYYKNADTFDPLRFARLRRKEGTQGSKYLAASTTAEYIPFGHGHHACPGRFFAASQMKALLAYIITNYDIKFAGDGKRPANANFGLHILPALGDRVLFRARQL
uniref:Cyp51A n=1 Tax=Ganoderma boninense TaxID=34458 RepID=A0A5K1JRB1_9APHY|nr:Cyp51A [Ganoderma boninense]